MNCMLRLHQSAVSIVHTFKYVVLELEQRPGDLSFHVRPDLKVSR